ncbi:MAG TPA: hypothetical protein VFX73_11465, partial [Chitinophagaceae bacterium]|nr:hypothetical protein [Chitinophagaceae bacterium]
MSMSLPKLRSLFGKRNETASFIKKFIAETGASLFIEDNEGKPVHGDPGSGSLTRVPVTCDEQVVGWVSGDSKAALIAEMLSLLVQKESEKKKLGSEVLTTYQELNVIFDFSEKLAQ